MFGPILLALPKEVLKGAAYMKKVILSPATPHGEIRVPPSKSAAHRAILCAALSHGRSVVDYIDLSADILATLRGADALGASVRPPPGGVIIDGTHAFQPAHLPFSCKSVP